MNQKSSKDKNVLGDPLEICGCEPITGYFRDGFCHTHESDFGSHTVCAIVDEEFLSFTKQQGNDLSTPAPEFGFVGLKPGDRWCLCASRWLEAFRQGKAPRVKLESTHEKALNIVDLEILKTHASVQ